MRISSDLPVDLISTGSRSTSSSLEDSSDFSTTAGSVTIEMTSHFFAESTDDDFYRDEIVKNTTHFW